MSLRPLILVALGLSLCANAFANERRYNVEIVIVENTDTSAGTVERWRPEVTVPDIEGAVTLPGPVELAPMVRRDELAELPEGFEVLPSDQRKLGGAIRKLKESGSFRVLRHLAWQQPALGEDEAPRIRVHSGEAMTVRVPIRDFDELYELESQSTGRDASSDEASAGDAAGGSGTEGVTRTFGADGGSGVRVRSLMRPIEIHPLDGTIRLVVSRYLHIYTDLYFTTPVEWTALPHSEEVDAVGRDESSGDGVPETGIDVTRVARGPDGSAMLSYPFRQHRRMRSGELHYLDHPVLGMLIRVDRAEEQDDGEGVEGGDNSGG